MKKRMIRSLILIIVLCAVCHPASLQAQNHTATWDWYTVDYYGHGTDFAGNAIDLSSVEFLTVFKTETYESIVQDRKNCAKAYAGSTTVDIDRDGTEELLILYDSWELIMYDLYTKINGEIVPVCIGEPLMTLVSSPYASIGVEEINEKRYFVTCYSNGGFSYDVNDNEINYINYRDITWVLYTLNGSELNEEIHVTESYVKSYETGEKIKTHFEKNNNEISAEEYDKWIDSMQHVSTLFYGGSNNIPVIDIDGKTLQELFSVPSPEYHKELALFAANLCDMSKDATGTKIQNYYLALGFDRSDFRLYDYGDDRIFSLARVRLSDTENLLIITTCGAQTDQPPQNGSADNENLRFYDDAATEYANSYCSAIMMGINEFTSGAWIDYLHLQNLKVLITGHGPGGAAANLVGATFTKSTSGGAWWSDLAEKEDIYCYTFGAPNTLTEKAMILTGYENIHNIYNIHDTLDPYDSQQLTLIVSEAEKMCGKYGHLDMFDENYSDSGASSAAQYTNHQIKNYIDAVQRNLIQHKSPLYMKSFLLELNRYFIW